MSSSFWISTGSWPRQWKCHPQIKEQLHVNMFIYIYIPWADFSQKWQQMRKLLKMLCSTDSTERLRIKPKYMNTIQHERTNCMHGMNTQSSEDIQFVWVNHIRSRSCTFWKFGCQHCDYWISFFKPIYQVCPNNVPIVTDRRKSY